MEKAVQVCKSDGRVSMIVPTGWYSGSRFSKLRQYIACYTDPELLVNLPYDVFEGWVDTTVFALKKRANETTWPRKSRQKVVLRTFPKRHRIESSSEFEQETEEAELTAWFANSYDEFLTYANLEVNAIIRKTQIAGKALSELADVQRGVTPFNLTDKSQHRNSLFAFAGTARRYSIESGPKKFIRFDNTLAEPKPDRYFKGPRLLLRELISRQFRLQAVKVTEDFVTNKSMQSILQKPGSPHLNYLLGMMNSRLLSWYFLHRSNIAQRDDFPKIVLKETRNLPIRPIDFSKVSDKTIHGRIVTLVDRMLDANKKKHSGKLAPSQLDRLEREIAATDEEIDELVYRLYGITEEERKIIEGT